MEVEGDKLDSFGGQVVILLSKTRVCEVRVEVFGVDALNGGCGLLCRWQEVVERVGGDL